MTFSDPSHFPPLDPLISEKQVLRTCNRLKPHLLGPAARVTGLLGEPEQADTSVVATGPPRIKTSKNEKGKIGKD